MEMMKHVREQWDRAAAVVLALIGAVFLLVGWVGVSDKLYPGEQIPYLASGGLGGVFLLGLSAVLWISADLRDEWRKLDELDVSLGQLDATIRDSVVAAERQAAAANGRDGSRPVRGAPARATTRRAPRT